MIRWSFFLTKESDKDFVKKDLSKRIDLNYVSFVECDYSYAELMDLDKWLFDFSYGIYYWLIISIIRSKR